MDIRYDTALRHAAKAWANQRTIDFSTLQDLKQHHAPRPQTLPTSKTEAAATAHEEPPALATFGHLGTRLNIFA